MSFITVYQCDDDGWLIGTSQAFESPLEPGVYQVPRGGVQEEPPADPWPEGTHPRWVAGRWILQAPHQGGV